MAQRRCYFCHLPGHEVRCCPARLADLERETHQLKETLATRTAQYEQEQQNLRGQLDAERARVAARDRRIEELERRETQNKQWYNYWKDRCRCHRLQGRAGAGASSSNNNSNGNNGGDMDFSP